MRCVILLKFTANEMESYLWLHMDVTKYEMISYRFMNNELMELNIRKHYIIQASDVQITIKP